MRTRVQQTLGVLVVLFLLVFFVQPQANLYLRDASLLSAAQSDDAYLQSQWLVTLVGLIQPAIVVCLFVLVYIWRHALIKLLKSLGITALLALVLVSVVACSPKKDLIVVEPNEVAFIVPLTGDNTDQQVIQNEDYWKSRLTSTTRIEVIYSWIQTGNAEGANYPNVRVIKVNTSSREIEWRVTRGADVDGDGNADWQSVFSGQSVNSEGLFTGMVVQARIDAEDAALYLASFGDRPLVDDNPADGTNGVLQTEVQNRLQGLFSDEVGGRTIEQINAELVAIFDNIETKMVDIFDDQGLTIEMVGNIDGIVYENDRLQEAIDGARVRELQLEGARNEAQQTQIFTNGLLTQTQSSVDAEIRQTGTMNAISIQQTATQAGVGVMQTATSNALVVQNAEAQATAVYLAGAAEAEALRLQAEAMGGGDALAQLEYNRRWNGDVPEIMFGQNGQSAPGFQMFMQLTPPAGENGTPIPTASATLAP